MSRCRETAGILFKKRCQFPSTQACGQCQKPICRVHVRMVGGAEICISCARTTLEDPKQRRSMAHLQEDPYFYWYYVSDLHDPYDESDYSLFEGESADFGATVDDQWEGT